MDDVTKWPKINEPLNVPTDGASEKPKEKDIDDEINDALNQEEQQQKPVQDTDFSKLELVPDEIDTVIYHSPCPDGTGAAYSAWKYLTEKFPDRKVEYYGIAAGANPPLNVTNRSVLICDISFRKEILVDMISKAKRLAILDHHISAQKDLAEIDDKYKVFRMDRSGAFLTWSYFFPDQPVPLLIQYIQDVDIWTKKLPNADAFSSWFSLVPYEFEQYDKYIEDSALLQMIDVKGRSMVELNQFYTQQACPFVAPKFMQIRDKFYFVGYLNSTVLKSDIGNRVFDGYPMIDFSCIYSINDRTDSTSISLRSTAKHVDVSVIASYFRGGGHRNASGMRIEGVTNTLPGKVFDAGRLYSSLWKIYFDQVSIEGKEFNIVYFNSNVHRSKLGKYFLQTKYTEYREEDEKEERDGEKDKEEKETKEQRTKLVDIQECVAIARIIAEQPSFYQHTHVAAIWDYQGFDDMTSFSITFDQKLSKEDQVLLSNWFGNPDPTNGMFYNGVVNKITKESVLREAPKRAIGNGRFNRRY